MKKSSILISILILFQTFLVGMNLDECREQTLQNNRSLKIEKENRKSAKLTVKSAITDFLPKVSATGAYSKMNEKFKISTSDLALPVADAAGNVIIIKDADGNAVLDENGKVIVQNWAIMPGQELELGKENIFIGSVNLTQPIFVGGKLFEKYQITKYAEEIAESTEDLTRQQLLLKTDEYFWRVISLYEKVKLANDYKIAVDKHVEDLQNYLNEGVITSNSMLKALVVQNEAELKVMKANNGKKLSELAINQLIGNELEADVQFEGSLDEQIQAVPTYNKEARAELKMLNSAVKITKSAKRIAWGQYLPNIIFNGSCFWLNPNPYNNLEEEVGNDWTVGIVAEMELFGWNKRGFTLAKAEHRKKAAEYELKEAQELISMQMIQEKYKQEEALKKVVLTNTGVQQAKENLQVTNDKFKEGLATSSAVLDAQTLWQKAVSENIDAKTEYQIQNTRLQKALGCL
ncbi:MAG: TolC family protein [Candidatus Cloacimonetes bacterium]|nr:TolC family protein [Candidatus Cloacimonadota bacterium]